MRTGYGPLVTYADPRLVALYDADNPGRDDHDFYRALAEERDARTILDLGCGTGSLTTALTGRGRTVVGVDPSAAMLDYARHQPGADAVTWVLGDYQQAPGCQFDLGLMTGNVAQHLLDPDWRETLRAFRGRLAGGGTLAFESRNPAARAWETWATEERTSRKTAHGTLIEWSDVTRLDDRTVEYAAHNIFLDSGDTVTERLQLVFRSRAEIEADLQAAGLAVESVYGDWSRTPMSDDAPVMVFVARAR
ncbi:methyltransferase type 11 [Flavimobilis marinus]|uniref:Methyltransferase domain-containing protein n=1 Tax=Flavimobilis marinus TaxID=285351 RepID=A0A1I2F3F9_9MICO|nr:methyltransferase type 11 [Flavimobilis marinus]SFE99051.1 Methyltransferase domain-containing protein [Flavimobilis marinus]